MSSAGPLAVLPNCGNNAAAPAPDTEPPSLSRNRCAFGAPLAGPRAVSLESASAAAPDATARSRARALHAQAERTILRGRERADVCGAEPRPYCRSSAILPAVRGRHVRSRPPREDGAARAYDPSTADAEPRGSDNYVAASSSPSNSAVLRTARIAVPPAAHAPSTMYR
jgi:hypothetical protein